MTAIKLLLIFALAGAANALECYHCKSEEYGSKCINNTSEWQLLECPPDMTVCYIFLQRQSDNHTIGLAERGCAPDMNHCKNLIGIDKSYRSARIALNCHVCNQSKCNSRNALNMNSSQRSSLNIFLFLLPIFMMSKMLCGK
ncbi:uncharacterized protein LOC132261542 [Phlebotomus argentipes]|uniref:uncharacterized protein LOC132261542 n=1 Tax=Phlebotomus argentipes TaxID=94469 RepID=UPI00289302CE|nr:uncharacterized protein LOC132261542 [Phlebotomus argentipes]